jgi:hypothetical protein
MRSPTRRRSFISAVSGSRRTRRLRADFHRLRHLAARRRRLESCGPGRACVIWASWIPTPHLTLTNVLLETATSAATTSVPSALCLPRCMPCQKRELRRRIRSRGPKSSGRSSGSSTRIRRRVSTSSHGRAPGAASPTSRAGQYDSYVSQAGLIGGDREPYENVESASIALEEWAQWKAKTGWTDSRLSLSRESVEGTPFGTPELVTDSSDVRTFAR